MDSEASGCSGGFDGAFCCGLREGGCDSGEVQPAGVLQDTGPVEVGGFSEADGGTCAIVPDLRGALIGTGFNEEDAESAVAGLADVLQSDAGAAEAAEAGIGEWSGGECRDEVDGRTEQGE